MNFRLSGMIQVFLISLALLALSSGALQAHNLEICKASDTSGPVTGVFSFSVSGVSGQVNVAVGACTTLQNVGAGQQMITELNAPGTEVSAITVEPSTDLVSSNPAARTVTVTVEENATTKVTFTNRNVVNGRFTGGGSIFEGDIRITHGFELHCSVSQTPNNLEINKGGDNFHLTALTSASCSLNNGVATITGTGTGTWNGVEGATITFTMTDAGEPGRNDFASFLITDVNGNVVINAAGTLTFGNQQFHPQ